MPGKKRLRVYAGRAAGGRTAWDRQRRTGQDADTDRRALMSAGDIHSRELGPVYTLDSPLRSQDPRGGGPISYLPAGLGVVS